MPIANTVLTKTEFEYLQQNITDQYNVIASAGVLAETGLHYVVLLQVDAPEVDLIDPFALQVTRSESLSDPKYFLGVVSAMDNHAITRSALAIATICCSPMRRSPTKVFGSIWCSRRWINSLVRCC